MSEAKPFQTRDGYTTYVRRWGAEGAGDSFIIGHGLISHSGVFGRLGDELARRGHQLVAPDRRGSGMCTEGKGDYHDRDKLVDDVIFLAEREAEARPGRRIHLIAWCGFVPVAVHAVARGEGKFATLTFIAPLFEGARSEFAGQCMAKVFAAAEGKRRDELIPAPAWGTAFVDDVDVPEVEKDPYIMRQMTLRSLEGARPFIQATTELIPQISIPLAAIIATRDRILVADKCRETVKQWIAPDRLFDVDGPHAPWYPKPVEVADILEKMTRP